MVKKCNECKKIIWPWQEKSNVRFDPVHRRCHQKILDEVKNNSELRMCIIKELISFRESTGINPNVGFSFSLDLSYDIEQLRKMGKALNDVLNPKEEVEQWEDIQSI